jgi:hypothetical protein
MHRPLVKSLRSGVEKTERVHLMLPQSRTHVRCLPPRTAALRCCILVPKFVGGWTEQDWDITGGDEQTGTEAEGCRQRASGAGAVGLLDSFTCSLEWNAVLIWVFHRDLRDVRSAILFPWCVYPDHPSHIIFLILPLNYRLQQIFYSKFHSEDSLMDNTVYTVLCVKRQRFELHIKFL